MGNMRLYRCDVEYIDANGLTVTDWYDIQAPTEQQAADFVKQILTDVPNVMDKVAIKKSVRILNIQILE